MVRGNNLPPLFLDEERDEDEIINASPREFYLGGKKYKSFALTNYQYQLLLSTLISYISNIGEDRIKDFAKNHDREELYRECLVDPNGLLNNNIEFIILSCCDSRIYDLLSELVNIEKEIETVKSHYGFIESSPKHSIMDHIKMFRILGRMKKLISKRYEIKINIDKIVNDISFKTSYIQWNIAFNYIVEQNDILRKALDYVKKKIPYSESIQDQ